MLKFGLGSMEVKTDWVEFWKGLVSLFLWLCMEVMLKGCLIDACGWLNYAFGVFW